MRHHHFNRAFRFNLIALLTMAMAMLFACGMGQRGNAPAPALSVDVLLTGTRGIDSRPELSAKWVKSREELEQMIEGQKARKIPSQEIDFNASRILLVRMGQKPTAGYSLKLDPESCSVSQQTAYISLIWTEPDPGMVTAQVITNPFILLKLSKGGYVVVKIVDQHEQTRFDLPVAK